MRTYGSCLSAGPATTESPDLPMTALSGATPQKTAAVRGLAGYALSGRSEDRRRYAETRSARADLQRAGETWRNARAWGMWVWADTGQGWKPSDMPTSSINPGVVASYLDVVASARRGRRAGSGSRS